MTRVDRSRELAALCAGVIPGGVNSPVRAFKAVGGTPRLIAKGAGPYLFDVDGNSYLDFCCSWGPLILGHAHPEVVEVITKQAALGTSYGATTEHEYRLAQFVVDKIPWVEKIRFVSSGTEATMSAIRLARGFTGRQLILKFDGCYHGHVDHLLVSAGSGLATLGTPSSAGVPEEFASQTALLPLDSEEALQSFFEREGERLAAVIIEGIPANNGLLIQTKSFMEKLRALTEQYGALLVIDEVITGFRLGWQGASGMYGITPDLCAYGKIIGGGLPVGAFGGRADIMDHLAPEGPVYQAGTLSGNPVAMVAGLATLECLERDNLFDQLERYTKRFVDRLRSQIKVDDFMIATAGSIFWIAYQKEVPRCASAISAVGIERFNSLHGVMLDAGIYLPPSGYEVCFVSSAHSDEVLEEAAKAMANVIKARFD